MKNQIVAQKILYSFVLGILSISILGANSMPVYMTNSLIQFHKYNSGIEPVTDGAKKFYTDSEAECIYTVANLDESGLSIQAFKYAYYGYHELLKKKKIKTTDYLTICDFSQSSKQKRLYVIDLEAHELLINTYVAHGKNSGIEFPKNFSNKPRSNQSSLGFYVTGETYSGRYGLSLRLLGIEAGFNDKALNRHIVLHGSRYVSENYLLRRNLLGRSFGCPAVPDEESDEIIETIKNGTCFFIYYPSMNYLTKSKILNS